MCRCWSRKSQPGSNPVRVAAFPRHPCKVDMLMESAKVGSPMQERFFQSELDQPHPGRARAIIAAHPEVRQLMVRNPWTAIIALSVVILQTSIAYAMGKLGFGYWWLSLLIAYAVGAFANHCNY